VTFLDVLNEAGENVAYTWKYYENRNHMTVFEPAATVHCIFYNRKFAFFFGPIKLN
jgi:hypothetical protein